jgi:REP element-mobilizing transposase RayT
MSQAAYFLDQPRRDLVLSALIERCSENRWILMAAHVRTNHVHVVIEAERAPERIMNDLKAYASRILNRAALDAPDRKRWARHGSTRWLWDRKNVLAAIAYVADKQGDPMAIFVATEHNRIT